jgi:hypothetical protein
MLIAKLAASRLKLRMLILKASLLKANAQNVRKLSQEGIQDDNLIIVTLANRGWSFFRVYLVYGEKVK